MLRQRRAEDAVGWLGGLAVGHQVQAPPGKEQGIELRRGQEAFEAQGFVLSLKAVYGLKLSRASGPRRSAE
jgi:hypothetical protein